MQRRGERNIRNIAKVGVIGQAWRLLPQGPLIELAETTTRGGQAIQLLYLRLLGKKEPSCPLCRLEAAQ